MRYFDNQPFGWQSVVKCDDGRTMSVTAYYAALSRYLTSQWQRTFNNIIYTPKRRSPWPRATSAMPTWNPNSWSLFEPFLYIILSVLAKYQLHMDHSQMQPACWLKLLIKQRGIYCQAPGCHRLPSEWGVQITAVLPNGTSCQNLALFLSPNASNIVGQSGSLYIELIS